MRLDDLSHADAWGPEKIVTVSDTRTGMRGVLVIDNTARGMGKGGTRMGPALTVTEVARLARVMTWKWAAVDLFFGGAKAGVRFDPASADKEAVLRAFARALSSEVPEEYVFGLDMGLTEHDAAVIQDELGARGAAVGSPSEVGGVPYDQWGVTGYGVAEAVDEAVRRDGADLHGARVVVQGFGAVGAAAAERLHELGARVVAVSTAEGALHAPDGLDVPALLQARSQWGDALVHHVDGSRPLAAGEELTLPADVLIPAARQDVVDVAAARDLSASVVVEGANLALTPKAQAVLAERGVSVVPDFIANAGGVVAAAYAMEARSSVFPVEPGPIRAAVSERLRANTLHVLEEAARGALTSHEAARHLAERRVRTAMEIRGRVRSS
ncbi:Glu/Leu/Phe/Val family dehydrogenase [Nocardiopsis suaedae]|uniref:Glutamate dehydrogenase n=1 Tax=Nocardiopsis suaedae TaxID=3018444 RepID=A0ABT4TIU2_9ACTN|nr:Glu/Leu/Phe/Val dehydrogenase dimerization domain-containing protein [Nocardiopsis suaedae]MDA2804184.1 NAD-glutamate dehydrogenase [Nocardiopsis suaedae]